MNIKIKLLLVFGLVFVSAIAIGSNMAFELNYTLLTNTDDNINWVSIPYFDNYFQSQNICDDINNVDCAP
jgi:hypothetical protein